MMGRTGRLATVVLIPLGIIAAGGFAAKTMIDSRPEPQKVERPERGVLVETSRVERTTQRVEVEAKGTVRAAQRLVVTPQVSGRVTSVHEKLQPGGLIEKGEVLFRIQGDDYRLGVEQARTAVDQAEAQLRIERGQQNVARKEWELFKNQVGADQDPSLALREPQLKVAEVNLEAAKARLERAKLDQSRTTVRAPFNLQVESESLEIGQLVGPNSVAATVIGTDEFWVQVSVPMDRLDFIRVPGVNAQEGSEVEVVQRIGDKQVTRKGSVVRLLGEVDPVGRMARVLVEIDDPLNLESEQGTRGLPLLVGSYVSVVFGGAREMSVVEIPRTALHEGNKVWVYDDGELRVRDVELAWSRDKTALVATGLETGDELVTSRIPTPLEGMKLRRAENPDNVAVAAEAAVEEEPRDE